MGKRRWLLFSMRVRTPYKNNMRIQSERDTCIQYEKYKCINFEIYCMKKRGHI